MITIFNNPALFEELTEIGVLKHKREKPSKLISESKIKEDEVRLWRAYANQVEAVMHRIGEIRRMPPDLACWKRYKLMEVEGLQEQILLNNEHIKLKAIWMELPCFKKDK